MIAETSLLDARANGLRLMSGQIAYDDLAQP